MMRGRAILLLMSVAVALLASAAVALAQTTGDEGRALSAEHAKSAPSAQPQHTTGGVIPGRYIVVLEDGTKQVAAQSNRQDPDQVANEMAQKNKVEEVTHTYESALKGFAAKIPQGRVDDVRSDPRVAFVAKDREVHATSQVLPTGVDRVDADQSSTRAGDGSGAVNADIAIIDSGIYRHSDLNVVGGYNCKSTDRQAWSDGNGHGTHVAGSAAAKDNTIGVVGTAPGARLWAIRVLGSNGYGSTSSVVCGINRVTQMNKDSVTTNNIEVANMSLGGGGADDGNCGNTNNDPMHKAICNSVAAKVTYVVAAGNESVNAARSVPAAYNEVITVSALADYDGKPWGQGDEFDCFQDWAFDDEFASFSNFGSDVDLGAPGVCIDSTWKGGGYETISGTSMASPHVAGAAALYKVSHPTDTPSQVRTAMTSVANTEALNQGHTDPSGRHPESVMLAKNLGKSYSAVGDFQPTDNPSGAWSYGSRASAGSSLILYTEHSNPWGPGIDRWSSVGASEPMIAYNGTGQTAEFLSIKHPASMLNLHPGPAGEKSVLRWTAPSAGTVRIEGRFEGIDTDTSVGGTTTDVAVIKNSGTTVFGGDINGFGDREPYSFTTSVAAGDTIDFVVGYGSNATHSNDSTGLSVTITPT